MAVRLTILWKGIRVRKMDRNRKRSLISELVKIILKEFESREFTQGDVRCFMKDMENEIRWSNEQAEDKKPFVLHED